MIIDGLVWLCVMIIACLAARDDWRGLNIPNQHSLVLLILFPLVVLSPAEITFVPGLLAGLLTLFLGLCLFALKQMGGGDVKLASVLSLYMGLALWPKFMLWTMLYGGVLALIALYLRRHPEKIGDTVSPHSWLGQLKANPTDLTLATPLPYGVAIAFAALTVLTQRLLVPYFMAYSGI
jgi:prepilin peptidase CpaA